MRYAFLYDLHDDSAFRNAHTTNHDTAADDQRVEAILSAIGNVDEIAWLGHRIEETMSSQRSQPPSSLPELTLKTELVGACGLAARDRAVRLISAFAELPDVTFTHALGTGTTITVTQCFVGEQSVERQRLTRDAKHIVDIGPCSRWPDTVGVVYDDETREVTRVRVPRQATRRDSVPKTHDSAERLRLTA